MLRLPASGFRSYGAAAAAFSAVAAIAVATMARANPPGLVVVLGVLAGACAALWMLTSENLDRPLVVFLLYLGLLDGFLKLRTNSSVVTLGRDALLYAICVGWLARRLTRREPIQLPPLSGWVLLFVCVTLLQAANPASHGILHTLGAFRPHLEFVPLFFIGYGIVRTRSRLRSFLLLLLVIATANGVINTVQLNLTPTQLSSWGPGYALRISGAGKGVGHVSGRTFRTSGGAVRTRPFGLGDDAGVGEAWGLLAIGGAVALVSLSGMRPAGRWALLLCAGAPLAVITGQGRSLLVGAIVALLAYVLLATTPSRLIPTLTSVLVGLAAAIAVVAYISSVSGAGVFDRYATITPSKIATTTNSARGKSIADVPRLLVQHPLGNGLGSVGPAAKFAGGGNAGSNGETEPGFLVSELGIPGLILYYAFNLRLLLIGAARIRLLEPETRAYVAALLAGLAGLLVVGISATTTATSPMAPYFWFASGAVSYWLIEGVRDRSTLAGRAGGARLMPSRS